MHEECTFPLISASNADRDMGVTLPGIMVVEKKVDIPNMKKRFRDDAELQLIATTKGPRA